MKPSASAIALAWVLLAACVGCEPAPIYGPDGPRPAVGSITPRSSWSVTGNIRDGDLACDGKIETAATASGGAGAPVMLIDLGQPCVFNFVAVDHGANEQAFARRVEIATSMDNRTFAPQLVGPGTRRVSSFLLRRTVLARYVRITAVEPGPQGWSLAEVHLQ